MLTMMKKQIKHMNCSLINVIYLLIASSVISLDLAYIVFMINGMNSKLPVIIFILMLNVLFFSTFKVRVFIKSILIKSKVGRINTDSDTIKYCHNYFSIDANNHFLIATLKLEPCFIDAETRMNKLSKMVPGMLLKSFRKRAEERNLEDRRLFLIKRSSKNWLWKTWFR